MLLPTHRRGRNKKRIPPEEEAINQHARERKEVLARIAFRTLALAAVCLSVAGCGTQPITSAVDSTGFEPVEVAALKTAYAMEGGDRSVLFVEVADASDEEFDEITVCLSKELGLPVYPADTALRDDPDLPVLTPYDPETGEVGVCLRIVRLTPTDAGTYEALVDFARNGLDGGSLSMTLVEEEAGGWVTSDTTQTAVAKVAE